MKYMLFGVAILGGLVMATTAKAETTQDHFKQVINKTPHQVEVCYDQHTSGDKSGDMLKGAIIGGIIGHNNSTATGGTRQVCRVETRYTETPMTVYSHSTVTFTHNGKTYTVRFQK